MGQASCFIFRKYEVYIHRVELNRTESNRIGVDWIGSDRIGSVWEPVASRSLMRKSIGRWSLTPSWGVWPLSWKRRGAIDDCGQGHNMYKSRYETGWSGESQEAPKPIKNVLQSLRGQPGVMGRPWAQMLVGARQFLRREKVMGHVLLANTLFSC